MMEFGKRLAAFRKEKGFSQQELADMMETSKTTVTNWETGRFKPTWDKLEILASIFEVNISTLIEGSDVVITMTTFKDRLKQLREEKGLTQQKLANEFGVSGTAIMRYEKGQRLPQGDKLSRVSIGNYERGDREPIYSTIIGFAKYFDVSTDYLLGLSDDRKPKVIVKQLNLSEISTDDLMREVARRWSQ